MIKKEEMMESIEKYRGTELNWLFDKAAGFVLYAHGETEKLAELKIQGRFASKAEDRSSTNSWKFKRAGMLQNNVSILDGNSGQEIALFKKKGLGGQLEFKNGETYSVTRNAQMTEYCLSKNKQPIITFQDKDNRPQIFLKEDVGETSKNELLILFLSYLIIMQRTDASFSAPY